MFGGMATICIFALLLFGLGQLVISKRNRHQKAWMLEGELISNEASTISDEDTEEGSIGNADEHCTLDIDMEVFEE